jgi:hypothetical protein
MNTAELKQAIDIYLDDRKTTLWGKSFDILSEDSREEAKRFIYGLVRDLSMIDLP